MGWWGKGVMEGDGPCDLEAEFSGMMEVLIPGLSAHLDLLDDLDQDGEEYKQEQPKLMTLIKEWLDVPENQKAAIDRFLTIDNEEANVKTQVFGVQLMQHQIVMTPEIKAEIIKAAQCDFWANEDEGRKAVMDEFIADVTKYDGSEPIVYEDNSTVALIRGLLFG